MHLNRVMHYMDSADGCFSVLWHFFFFNSQTSTEQMLMADRSHRGLFTLCRPHITAAALSPVREMHKGVKQSSHWTAQELPKKKKTWHGLLYTTKTLSFYTVFFFFVFFKSTVTWLVIIPLEARLWFLGNSLEFLKREGQISQRRGAVPGGCHALQMVLVAGGSY